MEVTGDRRVVGNLESSGELVPRALRICGVPSSLVIHRTVPPSGPRAGTPFRYSLGKDGPNQSRNTGNDNRAAPNGHTYRCLTTARSTSTWRPHMIDPDTPSPCFIARRFYRARNIG